MEPKNTLILLTSSFPYGYTESFVYEEMKFLSEKFDKVKIVPSGSSKTIRTIPCDNVSVILPKLEYKPKIVWALKVLVLEFLLISNFSKKLFFIQHLRYFFSIAKQRTCNAQWLLEHVLNSNGRQVFYSYWLEDWALALSILKMNGYKFPFASRCGGFDIYEERHQGNYYPFRGVMYKYLDRLYANSDFSFDYIKTNFPKVVSKLNTALVTHTDFWKGNALESEIYTIVSCSNVIDIKRVELIAQACAHLKTKYLWVHFGSGTGLDKCRYIAANGGVNVNFYGAVDPQVILDFYNNNFVDLFITTSRTEGGVPVSVKEAMSCGTPIFSTPVGGIDHIMNDIVGELLPMDIPPNQLALRIDKYLLSGTSRNKKRRKMNIQYWKDNFAPPVVYSKFATELSELKSY